MTDPAALDLPVRAGLRVLDAAKPDVLEVVDHDCILRVPKFTEDEVPLACYRRLADRCGELARMAPISVPRFAVVVAPGVVPPMTEPGPVSYVVVERVHGQGLDAAVEAGGIEVSQIDALLSGLAGYLAAALSSEAEILADVFHLDQYMVGRTASDRVDAIWLTDLEPQYLRLTATATWERPLFLIQVAELIRSLIGSERGSGATLTAARAAVGQLLRSLEPMDAAAASELAETLADPDSDGDYYRSAWFTRPS